MEYDLEGLRELGFDVKEVEKVLRISDLLEDVSNVKFLRDRISSNLFLVRTKSFIFGTA